MSSLERAFQQLDPLGALTGRPIALLAALGLPVFAVIGTGMHAGDVTSWPLAVLAIVAIVVSSVALVVATSPLRAPLSLTSHAVVTGLAGTAWLLSVLSTWGGNRYIQDDWAPIALGVVLLSLSPYRPPKEIASTGLVLALVAGVAALGQSSFLVTGVQPIAYAIVTMTPILALSLASAAFGQLLVEALDRWRLRAANAVEAAADLNTGWIARSVQQDRVTILNQDIVPFFSSVLARDAITEDDRQRAREISDAIRAIMVAEADRTWLDLSVEQATGAVGRVSDPSRLASVMTTDQRTALRAVLVAIAQHPACDRGAMELGITENDRWCRATLTAVLDAGEGVVRTEFAPFFAVLRVVFSDLKVELSGGTLTLRFSYEHR